MRFDIEEYIKPPFFLNFLKYFHFMAIGACLYHANQCIGIERVFTSKMVKIEEINVTFQDQPIKLSHL